MSSNSKPEKPDTRQSLLHNLAMYPGSIITYDPKGEIAESLVQDRNSREVYVLDPLSLPIKGETNI